MASLRAGAQYWRARAEVRTQADRMRDPASKRTILEIAESYDGIADLAKNHANRQKRDQ